MKKTKRTGKNKRLSKIVTKEMKAVIGGMSLAPGTTAGGRVIVPAQNPPLNAGPAAETNLLTNKTHVGTGPSPWNR